MEKIFLCILEGLMERLYEEDFEMMATITRRIWMRRNTSVFGGVLSHPSLLVRSAKESMEEFTKLYLV